MTRLREARPRALSAGRNPFSPDGQLQSTVRRVPQLRNLVAPHPDYDPRSATVHSR